MSTISKFLSQPPDNFSTQISSATVSTTDLSVTLDSTSGLPTEGVGQFFKKDVNGELVAGSVEFVHWTNVSGNTITFTDTDDRGITGSDAGAQSYVADDYFEVWASSYYTSYAGLVEHNADGTHKSFSGTITGTYTLGGTPTISSPTINTPTLTLANATTMTTDGGIVFDRTNEKLLIGDGTNTQSVKMGAWTSYTPTLSGGWDSTGNATLACKFSQIGKLVIVFVSITNGNTTTYKTGVMTFSLPITARASEGFTGACYFEDKATQGYPGQFFLTSTTAAGVITLTVSGSAVVQAQCSNTVPFTWANEDLIRGYFYYEAA